jgi:NitT/TauT family transport system substrate-binding protein
MLRNRVRRGSKARIGKGNPRQFITALACGSLFLGGLIALAVPGASSASAAGTQTNVKLVLGWTVSPEWAGYYAAKSLGYYQKAGLNVSIQAGGPDVNTETLVGAGQGQFGADALNNVFASNDTGTNLVDVAQISSRPGLRLISLKSKHLNNPNSWKGKTIGVFASDNSLYATFAKYHINPNSQVNIVQQGSNMNQFTSGQLDLASGYIFDEVGQIVASGIPMSKLNLYSYTQDGTSTLEDALFENGAYMQQNPAVSAKFVAASLKGWVYCRNNPNACVNMVDKAGAGGSKKFNQWSMNQFNQLLWPAPAQGLGYLKPAAIRQTATILYSTKVITKFPNLSALTGTSVYNAALKQLNGVDIKGTTYKPESGLTP